MIIRWSGAKGARSYGVTLIPVGFIGPVAEIADTTGTSITLAGGYVRKRLPGSVRNSPTGYRVIITAKARRQRASSAETSIRVPPGFIDWKGGVQADRPREKQVNRANGCLVKGGIVGAFAGVAALTFWIPGVDVVTVGGAAAVFAAAAIGGGGGEFLACIMD